MIIRPEAEADLADAQNWYNQQREGLGAAFLLCVEETLERILRAPSRYPKIHGEMRRVLIRRFPYAVYYQVEQDNLVVFAVLHIRRSSQDWQERN